MKVPGLGEISERFMPFRQPFPFETVPPLIEMAIDAFGAHRLMWGSDFPPVAGRREGYRNALRLPMEHVDFKSEEDKEWTFGKTATTLFRFGGIVWEYRNPCALISWPIYAGQKVTGRARTLWPVAWHYWFGTVLFW